MGILTDIKNWFILVIVLGCFVLYGWGYLGWNKYETAQVNIAQLKASLVAIQVASDVQLKKKIDSEKEYRTAYLFEKKQIDNMQDPDENLGCEESTQKAISDVLKLKASQ